MAIDVAVLRAKLRFESEGSQQAVQDAKNVEQALRGIDRTASASIANLAGAQDTLSRATQAALTASQSTSAEVRAMGHAISEAVTSFHDLVGGVQAAEARLAELGATQETVNQVAADYVAQSEAMLAASEEYGNQISDLNDQIKELTSAEQIAADARDGTYEKTAEVVRGLREEVKRLTDDQRNLQSEANRQSMLGQEVLDIGQVLGDPALLVEGDKRLARIEKSMTSLGKSTGATTAKAGGFLSILGRFNAGSGLTLSNLASIAARLTGLGVAAVLVVRGIQKMAAAFMEGARATDAFTRAHPRVAAMVQSLDDLGNTNLAALVGQLDDVRIRLSNMGAIDPVATTQQVVGIALDFQYLNATPDDLQATVAALYQAVESLDFSGLAQFDVGAGKIAALNQEFRDLAEQGMSRTELRTRALIELETIRQNQAGVAAQRQAAEEGTLTYALGQVETAFINATTNNESFTTSVKGMADTIASAQPTLDAFANFFASGLAGSVEVASLLVDGFRIGLHALAAGAAQTLKALMELFTLGVADTSGQDAFIAKQEAIIDQIQAINDIRDPGSDIFGMEAADQYANILGHLARQGSVTAKVFEDLKRATRSTNAEAKIAIEHVLAQADAWGLSADQIGMMEQALADYEREMKSATDAGSGFLITAEDIAEGVRRIRSEVSQGSSMSQQIQDLAVAFHDMQEDLNPRTAIAGLGKLSDILDSVINGGIENLDQFRLRAEAAFRLGFFDEAAFNEAQRGFDVLEEALAPIVAEAQALKEEQEKIATARLEAAGGQFDNLTATVNTTSEGVRTLNREIAAIDGMHSVATIEVKTIQTGGFVVPSGAPSGFGVGSTQPRTNLGGPSNLDAERRRMMGIQAGTSSSSTTSSNPTTADLIRNMQQGNDALIEEIKKNNPPRTGGLDDALRNVFDTFKLGKKGGGGASGADTLLDVEAIRAFIQEVNRAIAIASRGGVRISTAGNAIPFEEGSFLNAQGGGLSVDTILIRGVWDFADPAAKRQIIRELQEALQALQAEG